MAGWASAARSETVPLLLEVGDIVDEVVEEMLDHQGVCYEVLRTGMTSGAVYPLVIVSRLSDQISAIASKFTTNYDRVIAVENIVDLDGVLQFFSGMKSGAVDVFDPKVNVEEEKLVGAISDCLSRAGLRLARREFWPNGAKACCVLTHDVDWLTYSPFHWSVLSSGHTLRSLISLLVGGLRRKDYGWNFDTIVELETRYGYRSTFFFMTKYHDGENDLQKMMAMLDATGFEIALHGAAKSHLGRDALERELKSLEHVTGTKVKGVRHHILKFLAPTTWEAAALEDLQYDATFAHNRSFGFRGRVCFPYHPFGPNGRVNITELPTSFMDFTALARGMRGNGAFKVLERIMDSVEKHRGVLIVNFHNTYLNRETFPDMYKLYEGLLKAISARGYWVATAQQCTKWWNERRGSLNHSLRPSPITVDSFSSQDDSRVHEARL